jgi:hypothetical protein
MKTKRNQDTNTTLNTTQKQKWAKFTYIGKETRIITRLFKNTNIRIAYKTKIQYKTTSNTENKIQTEVVKAEYTK